ncbi:hypothetical protein O9992_18225 [Vibrio lentus]|nr:hypothetical protein [Vibrio lentus]
MTNCSARFSLNQTTRDGWRPYTGNGREDITALKNVTLTTYSREPDARNATDSKRSDFDFGYNDGRT